MNKKILLCVLSTSFASTVFANPNVIYGEDNRLEVYEAKASHQKLAKSTATMVHKNKMTYNDLTSRRVTLEQTSLNDWFIKASGGIGLCEGTRFKEQANPGDCSGFLIAPDLLVTAGHCAAIEDFCSDYKWVFDFKVNAKTGTAGTDIKSSDIYSCRSLLVGGLNAGAGFDYAVVRLDRRVMDREPLTINKTGKIEVETPLVVIGSPSGLPLKVADGAKVRADVHKNYFEANLDTFQGNSGSAVFNDNTGVVEGILVRGENDYVANIQGLCLTPNVCKEDECRGEDVSKMSSIPEVLLYDTLLLATEIERVDILKKIADLGLSLDLNLKDGKTALNKAAEKNKFESVKVLVQRGADVNYQDAQGNTPIMNLVKNNSMNNEIFNFLLKSRANLHIKNDLGQTVLDIAKLAKNEKAQRLITHKLID